MVTPERDKRLQQIRKRYEASTPGEWTLDGVNRIQAEGKYPGLIATTYLDENWVGNTPFIAHAHQDIPWLLAEIERLEEIIGSLGASQSADSTPSPPLPGQPDSITTGSNARITWHEVES